MNNSEKPHGANALKNFRFIDVLHFRLFLGFSVSSIRNFVHNPLILPEIHDQQSQNFSSVMNVSVI